MPAIVRYVNFYPPCDLTSIHPWRTTSWTERKDADRYARTGRIACIRVEFNMGDGLPQCTENCHGQ